MKSKKLRKDGFSLIFYIKGWKKKVFKIYLRYFLFTMWRINKINAQLFKLWILITILPSLYNQNIFLIYKFVTIINK